MATFIWQRRGHLTLAALVFVGAFIAFIQERSTATSGGSAYAVPAVTDTNPDPDVVETTITAQGAMVDLGQGVMASALTFNGQLPGPQFRLKVGDRVIVHFQNNAGHATGIHWHGIELHNASDGTPLTQNMVEPGDSFEYDFVVTRPGIYWYHPHHHSSTNQVFKGMYGTIIITDPNEAPLQASGVLPPQSATLTLALSDVTVCKALGSNDTETYDVATQPWLDGTQGPLPAQSGPDPDDLCDDSTGDSLPHPINEDGDPRGDFVAGDIPNIQTKQSAGGTPVIEGQTVLTNGRNVGGRPGTIADPAKPLGAPVATAELFNVQPGQGLRLQLGNTATTRFFRLRLTDGTGALIPLVRIGGQGGLLDEAIIEGGVINGYDTKYTQGEILLDPGDRQDVVAAIPATATGVLTLWTLDFARTGGNESNIPTVPVAHFNVTGAAVNPAYTIGDGTDLRLATGDPVEVLGPASGVLLDPATFTPALAGMPNQDIILSNNLPAPNPPGGAALGINGVQGQHDFVGDFTDFPHNGSSRYGQLGDVLELTTTNATSAHHPFHLHGFSIQPIEYFDADDPSAPTYTFPRHEFRDNIDVPKG
ncbi:MAG: multicopper oxidase domain-containing protein, partial [Vicinamibacterales bacterium]